VLSAFCFLFLIFTWCKSGLSFLNKKSSHNANYFNIFAIEIFDMKRIFAKSTLREYWENHADSEQYLKTWFNTTMSSNWKGPNDVKQTYASASILKNGRIVFNIKGNSYRLVVRFNYEKQWAFIKFIGTHSEYDKINADEI
jgi:mRNA interferase HigB